MNVIVVLRAFDAGQANALRVPLRLAQAAIALRPMFLRESEIAAAAEAFAPKFHDIVHRRKVLYGDDPFAGLVISRDALRQRLRQTLLNLSLRLRAGYVARTLREEQAALIIADAAGFVPPPDRCWSSKAVLRRRPRQRSSASQASQECRRKRSSRFRESVRRA